MHGQDLRLTEALRGALTTRNAVIAAGALDALPAVLRETGPTTHYLIVADANTWKAAGARTAATLANDRLHTAEPVVFEELPRVKPAAATARALAAVLQQRGALPIAVGAGVINDLVKYAATLAGRPYVSVPTAASMDGYAASGAALRDDGFKRTFACAAPLAVVADLDIIAAAPSAMAGWGYGDLAGKVVAGADWMLADAVGEEALNSGPFALIQDNLDTWLGDPVGVRNGRHEALKGLMRGLILSGLAMQAHGNSRPASGSDHQFAHLWEMEEISVAGLPVSHGACVGIGCLSMLAAYEWLLAQDPLTIRPAERAALAPSSQALRAEVGAAFPLAFMAANAETETLAKAHQRDEVQRRLARLQAAWPRLAADLRHRLPRAEAMRHKLEAAGAPSAAAAIGVPSAKHARDYARARLIRRRYTALDLLADLGWLEVAVRDLFGKEGFWAPSRAVA